MKKIITLILCLATLFISKPAISNECFEPCFNACSDLGYLVYADYLYWTATRPELTLRNANGIFSANAQYTSGFRVGAAIYYNCTDFNIRYTRILPELKINNPSAPILNPFNVPYNLEFNVVDLAFGYTNFLQCHRAFVRPYVGAKLAWLKEAVESFVVGTVAPSLTFGLTTHAYGPMFGVEGRWELFRCLLPISLIAQGDISLLYAHFRDAQLGAVFNNDKQGIVTVTDLYLALGFDICNFGCLHANLQVGYEIQNWSDMSGVLDPTERITPLGLSGLVVRLGAMF